MSIYVDALVSYGGGYSGKDAAQAERVGARNGHRWCHLFSDEQDPEFPALRAFAQRIGMKDVWFQGDHFDLTPGRRAAAVKAGAKEVTRREAVAIWRRTPRARVWRCKKCKSTIRAVVPPPTCPGCSRCSTNQ